MANCGNCRHYYGKVENYRYFCCAMHPHGLPAEDCPDWQEGYNSLAEPNCLSGFVTPEIRRMIDLEYERELKRMKRHNAR